MLTHLRNLRLMREMKLNELATRLGIKDSYLSKIERGKLKGNKETREKLSSFFSVPENILFKGI